MFGMPVSHFHKVTGKLGHLFDLSIKFIEGEPDAFIWLTQTHIPVQFQKRYIWFFVFQDMIWVNSPAVISINT